MTDLNGALKEYSGLFSNLMSMDCICGMLSITTDSSFYCVQTNTKHSYSKSIIMEAFEQLFWTRLVQISTDYTVHLDNNMYCNVIVLSAGALLVCCNNVFVCFFNNKIKWINEWMNLLKVWNKDKKKNIKSHILEIYIKCKIPKYQKNWCFFIY